MALKKIVILFSGRGSNMQSIIEKLHGKSVEVAAAITNNPNAKGIEIARGLGVHVDILPHTEYASREEFDAALVAKIREYSPEITVLAGFMRILSTVFTDSIKAINIHPSLLPLFKGKDGIQESFISGMDKGGVTVHFVTSEMDGGEIVLQESVPILSGDTLESFAQRVHATEHELYPKAILKVLAI
ncbi:MAG TPA: phosphoribosylglycinamide formyltransferase [Campylobacterales bacterium]|nr:phosphoribosylglycinamide formyltransferase [Campylobacterales bacterium]